MPQNRPMVDLQPRVLAPGALLLPGHAAAHGAAVRADVTLMTRAAPFRHMHTPGGFRMSVAMTCCGTAGWTTDRSGYRYRREDPASGEPWPAMPAAWATLARDAAALAGYSAFDPDSCLINRYEIGARMSLHQDRDERDLAQPVVSVSFGLPATFLFGGLERGSPVQRIALRDGDVVVWGGPSRLVFHGIAPLRAGGTSPFGPQRINLTFRRAF
jgi:alkylated DNA repair protein (DNA oxidative demethylase)